MKIRLATGLQTDSIVDGEGLRTVIWTQGCLHNCYGCHNPETHSFTEGKLVDVEVIKEELSNLKLQDGVTFSGGDPMCQVDACLELARHCQSIGLNVWMYTGYTLEELLVKDKKNINELLTYIDVLIDGKFEIDKKSYDVMYRGSTNQRIIDVKASLKENKVVTIDKYDNKTSIEKVEENYVYI